MCHPTATVEELAARTREAKDRTAVLKQRFMLREATYEEMVDAAKAFCKAFDEYHKAKFGKSKKLDYRAVLR